LQTIGKVATVFNHDQKNVEAVLRFNTAKNNRHLMTFFWAWSNTIATCGSDGADAPLVDKEKKWPYRVIKTLNGEFK
jgi:hypothetical protein